MEIVTYVLHGALEHRDSTGIGIMYSEFNHSKTEPVHLLQIWFFPDTEGLTPEYEQKNFSPEQRLNVLRVVASGKKDTDGVFMHQDATMSVSRLETGHTLMYPVSSGRGVYLYLIDGSITVNQMKLSTGDAAIVDTLDELAIAAGNDSEIALFDVPL
jgi:redox-sensitive bicupin YhaK (pirin superfamily)